MFSPSFAVSATRSSSSAALGARPVALDRLERSLHEREEVVVLRDRLRLAADGDERPARRVAGDPIGHPSLGRRPTGPLRSARHALLAEQAGRELDVAVRILERALAVHHPRARPLAELLHEACRDLAHSAASVAPSAGATAAATGSSAAVASPAVSSSSVTFDFAAAIPSAIARTTREHERIASSLPGTT